MRRSHRDHRHRCPRRPGAGPLGRPDGCRGRAASALAHVLGTGDLYQLYATSNGSHTTSICAECWCKSALSRPYQWIEFKDGDNPPILTLYFKPSAAAQVLRNNHITVDYPRKEIVGELFVWEAHGRAPDGREGSGTKYVSLTNRYGKLTGKYLANAIMSAETAAARRLALNMGLASGPRPRRARDDADGLRRRHGRRARCAVRGAAPPGRQSRAWRGCSASRRYETTAARWPAELVNDLPDQRPRPEEFAPPARPYSPPARFYCDAERWQKRGLCWCAIRRSNRTEACHDFVQRFHVVLARESPHVVTLGVPVSRHRSPGRSVSHATVNGAREWPSPGRAGRRRRQQDVPADERDAVEVSRPSARRWRRVQRQRLRLFYRAWADALKSRDTAFAPIYGGRADEVPCRRAQRRDRGADPGQCENIDEMAMFAEQEALAE